MAEYHSRGGLARAANQSSEERRALALKAVAEKAHPTVPKATHSGSIKIGDKVIDCAVIRMPNGEVRRILSAMSIGKLMGRTNPNAKMLKNSRATGTPYFLAANNLKPFITNDFLSSTYPLIYKNKNGHKTKGFDYRILTEACEIYLKARDANCLTKDQLDLAKSCEMLLRSFAQVGLVSLIDEASGYQEVRDRHALQALLDKYLRAEFAEWAKRFPDEFYKQIFRLNNWKFEEIISKKPSVVGKYTNDIVYARLLPELVDELERRNPKKETGYREAKHHQLLNEVGNGELSGHIRGVIAIMKASENWKDFKLLLDKIYPIKSIKDVLLNG